MKPELIPDHVPRNNIKMIKHFSRQRKIHHNSFSNLIHQLVKRIVCSRRSPECETTEVDNMSIG
jgi:hypothetical protein